MAWIYVLVATAGLVLVVPVVARALDQPVVPDAASFVGFALTGFGVTGALAAQFPTSLTATLIAALAVGLAAGAVHPEILAELTGPSEEQQPDDDRLASDS